MSASTTLSHLKPHKAEAIYRIRTNAFGLITILVLSYLLPLPSLPTALRTLLSSSTRSDSLSESQVWMWICIIEMGLVTVMGYNVLEASYAIKYPRAPLPPVSSKASKTPISSPFSPTHSKSQRPFKLLSPNSSPQPQRAFAFNPSASNSSPLASSSSSRAFKNAASASASASVSASSPGANAPPNPNSSTANPAPYAQSPVSTPSRVLHYTVPPSASTTSNASVASTSSEYLATPSPVVSAYRGKHIAGDVGRAFDGSYLSRISNATQEESDED